MKFNINYKQIENLDVIKFLIDYVYKKRDPDSTTYRKKKAAFEQIIYKYNLLYYPDCSLLEIIVSFCLPIVPTTLLT